MRTKRFPAYGLLAVFITSLLTGCGEEPASEPATAKPQTLPDFTGLVQAAAPSVVNISTKRPPAGEDTGGRDGESGEAPFQDWLKRFFEEGEKRPQPPSRGRPSMGSGFVISEDGYILTSRHVVQGDGRIVVKFSDRQQMSAKRVGADKYSDIAVLKVDADNLQPVETGSPDKLKPGAWVVAIGSPFGFETSVTAGIVSAKKRSLADDQYVPFIQTDVAINPGNSGGPLFNLEGKVVGVNAQIYSRSGGFQGVSFAVPIDIAMDVAEQLKESGSVARGWLGVQIQEVDLALSKSFDMAHPRGALVAHVLPDSPAADSELQSGDVIVGFDGRDVPSAAALPPLVGLTEPGSTVDITVLRDGERQTLEVEIGELDKDAPQGMRQSAEESSGDAQEQGMGLRMRSLNNDEREQLGVSEGGVRILEVGPGPGREAGLKAGDVILALGPERVSSPEALRRRLAEADGPVALRVQRNGSVQYVPFNPDQ